jgi:hypothetical protein
VHFFAERLCFELVAEAGVGIEDDAAAVAKSIAAGHRRAWTRNRHRGQRHTHASRAHERGAGASSGGGAEGAPNTQAHASAGRRA